jgi:hypothetical protein
MELPAAGQLPGPSAVAEEPAGSDHIAEIYREAERAVTLEHGAMPAAPVGQGRHLVLVVEDEPDMRHFLTSVLSPHHRVIQAADGASGLQIARTHRP